MVRAQLSHTFFIKQALAYGERIASALFKDTDYYAFYP